MKQFGDAASRSATKLKKRLAFPPRSVQTRSPVAPLAVSSPPTPSDRSANADESATLWFAQEVEPHASSLKAYLRGSFPSVRDLDDVVQESYLRIWKARSSHPIDSARAFLFTIARRLAIRTVRKDRAAPLEFTGDALFSRAIDESPNPAEALNYREKVALLAEALIVLPPRCRDVVVLRKLQRRSQREVADRLGLSERTVENQLARGIRRCERFFRARGVDALF